MLPDSLGRLSAGVLRHGHIGLGQRRSVVVPSPVTATRCPLGLVAADGRKLAGRDLAIKSSSPAQRRWQRREGLSPVTITVLMPMARKSAKLYANARLDDALRE